MPSFAHRSENPEIMDDLHCRGEVVNQTLRELDVINRWLGGSEVTLYGVRQLLGKQLPGKTIRIADLGCGGGDILRQVSLWAKRRNLRARLVGIDANPHIIAFASDHSLEFPDISFEPLNIFSLEFRTRKFDIVLATLFIHHFTDSELIDIFSTLKAQAEIGIVVNDIHRHWFAYQSILLLTRFFSKSAMVKYDAPLSVLRAFRRSELEKILAAAGITYFKLRWKWAFRWQLIIPAQPFVARD